MKTNTFRWRNYYIIEVYYKDKEGRIRRHRTTPNLKSIAKQIANLYKNRIGTIFEDDQFTGEIIDVFTFEAIQCRLED